MKTIIYIYTKDGVDPILQIFDAVHLSMSAKTNEVSSASFSIPVWKNDGTVHPALQNDAFLMKWNRVVISTLDGNTEKVQYEGHISGVRDGTTSTMITVSDRLGMIEKRMILEDKIYTTTSLSGILVDIFNHINAVHDTGISVSCNVSSIVPKEFIAGQYILDILTDLAQGWYQYVIRWETLYFWDIVGEDKSTWPGTVELQWDYKDSRNRNITDFSFDSESSNISNAIYAKPSGWGSMVSAIDNDSILAYWRREELISANGNLTEETSKYLAIHKDDTIELFVNPSINDYAIVNAWDIVRVSIDRGDARWKYNWTMQVVGKEYSMQWDLPNITLSLSSSKIRTPNILEKLKKMDADIKKLKAW